MMANNLSLCLEASIAYLSQDGTEKLRWRIISASVWRPLLLYLNQDGTENFALPQLGWNGEAPGDGE